MAAPANQSRAGRLCADARNTPSCQWIHKSSAVHTDTLCDHMLHALLILLTLYCSAHLLMCLTHNLQTHTWCFMLSEHGMSGEHYLCGERAGGDSGLFVRHSWRRVTAATFLALTSSPSHIHMFMQTCTLSGAQTFVLTEENPSPTLRLPCPCPAVASQAIYSARWFIFVCSFQPLCNLSLTYLWDTKWSVCLTVVSPLRRIIYIRI